MQYFCYATFLLCIVFALLLLCDTLLRIAMLCICYALQCYATFLLCFAILCFIYFAYHTLCFSICQVFFLYTYKMIQFFLIAFYHFKSHNFLLLNTKKYCKKLLWLIFFYIKCIITTQIYKR